VPYLSASAVVIHYEEALYQVYAPLPYYYYYYYYYYYSPLPLAVFPLLTTIFSVYLIGRRSLQARPGSAKGL